MRSTTYLGRLSTRLVDATRVLHAYTPVRLCGGTVLLRYTTFTTQSAVGQHDLLPACLVRWIYEFREWEGPTASQLRQPSCLSSSGAPRRLPDDMRSELRSRDIDNLSIDQLFLDIRSTDTLYCYCTVRMVQFKGDQKEYERLLFPYVSIMAKSPPRAR